MPQQGGIPTCLTCGVKGYFSNQCKENVADDKKVAPTDSKSFFKCYNCGGFGHMARRCPDNENKNNEKVNEPLPAESVRGI